MGDEVNCDWLLNFGDADWDFRMLTGMIRRVCVGESKEAILTMKYIIIEKPKHVWTYGRIEVLGKVVIK